LLSLVRSSDNKKIGFLKESNRVCVALSRAKQGFYCIGNFDHLSSCSSDVWLPVVNSLKTEGFFGETLSIQCKMHGNINEINEPKDFFNKAPEGGCNIPCNTRLDCGHTCEMPCHAMSHSNERLKCRKPCEKKCKNNHKCNKLCSQPCGNCWE